MATTPNTTTRMVPFGGEGSSLAAEMSEVELGGTVAIGDVLVMDGAAGAVEDNTQPAVSLGSTNIGIMGVAMEAGVDGDIAQYAPAFPGRMFEANIINGASDVAVPTTNALMQVYQGIEVSADGFACIDQGSSVEVTHLMGWGRQTRGGPEGTRWIKTVPPTGALPTNPRVLFVFASSVFALSA